MRLHCVVLALLPLLSCVDSFLWGIASNAENPIAQFHRALTEVLSTSKATRSLRTQVIDGPSSSLIESVARFFERLCNPRGSDHEVPLGEVISFATAHGSPKSVSGTVSSLPSHRDPHVLTNAATSFETSSENVVPIPATKSFKSDFESSDPAAPLTVLDSVSNNPPIKTLPESNSANLLPAIDGHSPTPVSKSVVSPETSTSDTSVLPDALNLFESNPENVALLQGSVPTNPLTKLESVSKDELPAIGSTSTLLEPRPASDGTSTSVASVSKDSSTVASTLPESVADLHVSPTAYESSPKALKSISPKRFFEDPDNLSKSTHPVSPTDLMGAAERLKTVPKDVSAKSFYHEMPPATPDDVKWLDEMMRNQKSLVAAYLQLSKKDSEDWLSLYVRYAERVYQQDNAHDLFGVRALSSKLTEETVVLKIIAGLQSKDDLKIATADRLLDGLIFKWERDGKSENHINALCADIIAKSGYKANVDPSIKEESNINPRNELDNIKSSPNELSTVNLSNYTPRNKNWKWVRSVIRQQINSAKAGGS